MRKRGSSTAVKKRRGSPGLVVIGGDSCSGGRGFKSQQPILDGDLSQQFVVKVILIFV